MNHFYFINKKVYFILHSRYKKRVLLRDSLHFLLTSSNQRFIGHVLHVVLEKHLTGTLKG
jgi:hypothetical protein